MKKKQFKKPTLREIITAILSALIGALTASCTFNNNSAIATF